MLWKAHLGKKTGRWPSSQADRFHTLVRKWKELLALLGILNNVHFSNTYKSFAF